MRLDEDLLFVAIAYAIVRCFQRRMSIRRQASLTTQEFKISEI